MRYLKSFNEAYGDGGFDPEDYSDFLLSFVEERFIAHKDETENMLYVEYRMNIDQLEKLKEYIHTERFSDVIVYDYLYKTEGVLCILIVSEIFYKRNEKYLYENLTWVKDDEYGRYCKVFSDPNDDIIIIHDERGHHGEDDEITIRFPGANSLISEEEAENYQQDINLSMENMAYTQFIIFKYFGK